MACPFFMPVERLENGAWLHAHRLPLGCGWAGRCTAPGHDGESPTIEELQNFCNLGYAQACERLPRDREWDSIRFSARTTVEQLPGSGPGSCVIRIHYVCERTHLPAGHGFLQFDATMHCSQPHSDARLQRMAECFLATYMERRNRNELNVAS